MGLGALFALVFEQLFDRFRLKPMAGTTIVSAQFALFISFGDLPLAMAGMVCLGGWA
jgi:hypothetical protein